MNNKDEWEKYHNETQYRKWGNDESTTEWVIPPMKFQNKLETNQIVLII